MRKLTTLMVCALFALTTYGQKSEMFNTLSVDKYNGTKWVAIPQDKDIDYIITMDLTKHTLLITRSKDNLQMEFVQVNAFLIKDGSYIMTGILVAEDRSTFPVCGYIRPWGVEINFGRLIYLFHREEYSDRL